MGSYPNDYRRDAYHYHYDPDNPLSGYSLPRDTSLYSNSLTELSHRTSANLNRLKETLTARDPCYEYGIQNWHPDRRKLPEDEPQYYPAHASPNWASNKTVFTSRAEMDRLGWKNSRNEDEEETSSNGSAVPICYLCSTLEEHQRHLVKRGVQLKAKKKPRPRVEFIAPLPAVRKKKEEEEEEKERLYKVTVRTSNKPNAATSANIFLKIRGSHGSLRKRQLTKKMSVQFTFGRGTSEVFHIKGPILGDIHYITVEHDGLERKHSWLLDEIEIKDMASEVIWVCPCKQWFSLFEGDGILKRQLKAYVKEVEQIEYEIVVYTGTKPRSGTTANVSLTMYGKNGASPKLKLSSKKDEDAFSKGKTDTFHHVIDDLGPIVRCRIEHDDTGDSPDWFLEKIAIEDLDDSNRCYIFPCGQWLSSQRDECMTYRELYPVTKKMALLHAKKMKNLKGQQFSQKDERSEVEKTRYEVTVITGDRRYAGTDANVYLEMSGKHGKSGEIKLDDHKNNFERGQTDVFKITAAEIGNIKRIRLRHDNSGLGAGWFLEAIKIKKYFSKSEILHRLSQVEAQKEEELAERLEKEDRRSGSPPILKHRKSLTTERDSDDERKTRRKKQRDSSSEDEYDGHGRKIKKDKRNKKYRSKYNDNSSDEEYRRKKKGKSKYRSDSEDSEDEYRRKMRRKGKRMIKYNGIEQWITDSDEDDDRKSKRRSSKYDDDYDDRGRRKSKKYSSRYDDEDSDEDYKRRRKKKYDDSDSDDYKKSRRRKSKVRFHDEFESDENRRWSKKSKKRRDSDSESDSSDEEYDRKKRKGRRRRESSSEESGSDSEESLSNVRAYTTWKKDRVPYCDEYVFPCKKWFATDEGDGKIERELKPDEVVTFYRVPPDSDRKKNKRR